MKTENSGTHILLSEEEKADKMSDEKAAGWRWREMGGESERHVCELFPVVMRRIESCLLTHTETIVFCICGNQCHQLQSLPGLH